MISSPQRAPRPGRFVCALLLGLVAGLGPVRAQQVVWRGGPPLRPSRTAGETAGVLAATLAAGDGSHLVVQLAGPASRALRQRLAAAGLELGASLGGGASFARLVAGRLDTAALLAEPALLGLAPVDRSWKLHPELAGGATPQRARLGPGEQADVAAYVVVHRDTPADGVAQQVAQLGGRVTGVLRSINGLVVELPRNALERLVDLDAVQWVEPPLPPLADVSLVFNDSNSALTQVDTVKAPPYGLDGSGVTVMVYDGGYARESHVDFGGRLTVRDGSGLSDHATHVAATIGGSGAASGGTFQGMAPGVTLESYGFQYDGSGTFLYTNPGDFEADYLEATTQHGAVLANNSIGTNTEPNGFACNIQGDYGVMSSVIDAVVAGSLGAPLRVVWANGNERQGDRCDVEGFGDYFSTAPPATAKNHLTVGALNSNDDSMTGFSSWGPTDDGRMKPDVSAPGCQSNGDGGVTSAGSASDTALALKCGTSMASPTVAGCVALLMEDHRVQVGGDPLPSSVKVLLAHTAVDGFHPGPDNQYGYGSIRIADAIDQLRSGRLREGMVADQGARVTHTVSVAPGAGELRLTLAWDDAPGTPNVLPALVNDLDLVVTAPDGTRHFPWTLDPAAPGSPAVRTAPNRVDNLEQVLVDAPAQGTWRVEVVGHGVPEGPQSFSLTSSHDLLQPAHLEIGFPGGLPEAVAPAVATSLDVRVTAHGESLAAAPELHLSDGGGPVTVLALAPLGGDLWRADLPAFGCGQEPRFHIQASGTASGLTTSPVDAPVSTYGLSVEQTSVLFSFDMEDGAGWSVSDTAISSGSWERGLPADDGGRNDPVSDFDGSGACWLTGNSPDEDLDGGPTRLTSPSLDLSGLTGEVTMRVAVWMANDDFDVDALDIELSSGGGPWVAVESLGNTSGWSLRSFRPADFVSLGSDVRVRFSATDEPNNSITEAAVDGLIVLETRCDGPDPWLDLGHALAGVAGEPRLTGSGPLTVGSANAVQLDDAAPGAPLALFVALDELPVAFKGGTLLTVPVAATLGLTADGSGQAGIGFSFPGGLPGGFTFVLQAAVADGAAVQGVALSNALSGTTP